MTELDGDAVSNMFNKTLLKTFNQQGFISLEAIVNSQIHFSLSSIRKNPVNTVQRNYISL